MPVLRRESRWRKSPFNDPIQETESPTNPTFMQSNDEGFLDDLLKKLTNKDLILADDYSRLTSLFTSTTASSTRAKAFLVLSSICERHRQSPQASTTEEGLETNTILNLFLPSVESRLVHVEEQPLLEVLSFVAALFAVDWRVASSIFTRDGFQDSMMDSFDLFPSSTTVSSVIANVLSSACGYKPCRTSLSPRCSAWLESTFRHATDVKLKATASLALLKSSQGRDTAGVDAGGIPGETSEAELKTDELYKSVRDILMNTESNTRDIEDVVEALVYLSTKPSMKEQIVGDEGLVNKIVSFRSSLQRKKSSAEDFGTLPFGLAAFIANLCSYRPRLTEEQAQIERLKQMAQSSSKSDESKNLAALEAKLDDDEHVKQRGKRLLARGASDLLVSIARASESATTMAMVGRAFLGLIEDKDNRGRILQSGGVKVLITIIRASQQAPNAQSTSTLAKANMEFSDLLSVQALAKLAITASPMQVFGPNENNSIEAIKPFSCLLLHSSSTLLQRFEAIMALTNLASAGPELANRIAQAEGVISKLEFLMLEEHQLVRRAATELICNLVSGSEMAFNRFSGDGDGSPESSGSLNQSKSRLHILIALADVDDEPTRLAASGALAVLTSSPTACRLAMLLEFEHHRVFPVLKQLIYPEQDEEEHDSGESHPNPGLVHRGVVCFRNICMNLSDNSVRSKLAAEAVQYHLVDALANVVKSAGRQETTEAILRPTAEALKWLMDSGVNVLA